MSDHVFHLWLEPLRLEGLEGDQLLVGAPDAMRCWVADRFGRLLQACAAATVGPAATVTVVPLGSGAERAVAARTPAVSAREEIPGHPGFNPKYTFEQFILGEDNQMAHAAALSVAELPGQAYNPLFVYGAPGLGKTHLLHAIANYLAVNEPSRVVRYATAESFTNQFVHSLDHKPSAGSFKARYREADVLLIDDVQFLERKAATEEEFFHTFNHLYEDGAQLVLTSDRMPRDLQGVADRLRERFEAGLVTAVHPPDRAMRLALLHKRAAHDGHDIPAPALELIADRVTQNIRSLEGALIRVVAFASLRRHPVDVDLTAQVLDELYAGRRPARRSVADIQRAIGDAFGVTVEELRSPSRVARISWPRQAAMYLARELTDASLNTIGREFGGRNHSTVLTACDRARQRIAEDRDAYEAVDRVTKQLRGPGEIRSA